MRLAEARAIQKCASEGIAYGVKKSTARIAWTLPLGVSPDKGPIHNSANMVSANMVSVAPNRVTGHSVERNCI